MKQAVMDENGLFLHDHFPFVLQKFVESVDSHDLKVACRLEHLLEECVKRSILDQNQLDQLSLKQDKLKDLVLAWKMNLAIGDSIEVYQKGAWYTAKVVDKIEDGRVKIHYVGWPKDDQVVSLLDRKVQPAGSLISKDKPKRGREAPADAAVEAEPAESSVVVHPKEEPPADETLLIGSNGRPLRKSRAQATSNMLDSVPVPPKPEKKSKASRSKNNKAEINDENYDAFCSICGMRENACALDPLMCEGTCLRIFHRECLNLEEEPEHWYCDQCSTGKHVCALCGVAGVDYSEVQKCSVGACGKYFHSACLEAHREKLYFEMKKCDKELLGLEKDLYVQNHQLSASSDGKALVVPGMAIRCPRHFCDTCYGDYGAVSEVLF
eukprot:gene38639-46972_t